MGSGYYNLVNILVLVFKKLLYRSALRFSWYTGSSLRCEDEFIHHVIYVMSFIYWSAFSFTPRNWKHCVFCIFSYNKKHSLKDPWVLLIGLLMWVVCITKKILCVVCILCMYASTVTQTKWKFTFSSNLICFVSINMSPNYGFGQNWST